MIDPDRRRGSRNGIKVWIIKSRGDLKLFEEQENPSSLTPQGHISRTKTEISPRNMVWNTKHSCWNKVFSFHTRPGFTG